MIAQQQLLGIRTNPMAAALSMMSNNEIPSQYNNTYEPDLSGTGQNNNATGSVGNAAQHQVGGASNSSTNQWT